MENIILATLLFIVGFVFYYYIVRWILGINEREKQLDEIIKLLKDKNEQK